MSHFTVMVIGENAEEQLAPFHEFESTGIERFVQEIDQTVQYREDYEKQTRSMFRNKETGQLFNTYEDQFYREPLPEEKVGAGTGFGDGIRWDSRDWKDGKGYRAKVAYLPADFEEVEVRTKDRKSFLQFVQDDTGRKTVRAGETLDPKEHKYGYILLNEQGEVEKVIDRTNPNRKWDWYTLGGRWTGFFKLKKPVLEMVEEVNGEGIMEERKIPHKKGSPGLGAEPCTTGRADCAMIKDIDIEGMMDERGDSAGRKFDIMARLVGLESGEPGSPAARMPQLQYTWKQLLDGPDYKDLSVEEKRKLYWGQPILRALNDARKVHLDEETRGLVTWGNYEDFDCTRKEYVDRARNSAFQTFAVLKDGQWYERGSMGWFGCVSGEVDENQWSKQFTDLIKTLDPETVVSIYDCHI